MSVYIGLVSAALLCYQVLVTRMLSAPLLYHYAFLVASFSVMGMGLGAMLTAYIPRLQRHYVSRAAVTLSAIAVLLATAFIASFLVFAFFQFGGPLLYTVACLPPNILGGAALALILSHHGDTAGRLYAGDLLGAAAGAIGTLFILDTFGMQRAWIFPPALALLAALVQIGQKNFIRALAPAALLLLLCAGFVAADGSLLFGSDWRAYRDSPHKFYGKLSAERGPNALTVVHTSWDSFSRTDVIELMGEPDRKAVTIDGVAYSGMFRFSGDTAQINQYPDNAGYLPSIGHVPFAYGSNEQVLILGSGAGRDILYALHHGSTEIDAVEINRGSTAAVKRFSDFNGHLYDRPGVQLFETDGRSFTAHSTKRYDLILLTLIKTEAVGAAGLSAAEDYMLTREAFTLYLAHLKDNGRLALFVHHETALAKAAATALVALKDLGIDGTAAPDHLAVFNSHKLDPSQEVYQPLLLVSRAPITKEQARALAISAESRGNLVGYLPGLREEGRMVEVKTNGQLTPHANGQLTPHADHFEIAGLTRFFSGSTFFLETFGSFFRYPF